MNSPTPLDKKPSPKVVKFDFTGVLKKLSTLASAIVTAAGAVLTWYISQPDYVQETFPKWILATSSTISLLGVVLVPLATSYMQKSFKKE